MDALDHNRQPFEIWLPTRRGGASGRSSGTLRFPQENKGSNPLSLRLSRTSGCTRFGTIFQRTAVVAAFHDSTRHDARRLSGAFGAVNALSLYVERGRVTFDAVHVEAAARVAHLARERRGTADPCLWHWCRSGFVVAVHRGARQRGDRGPAQLSRRDPRCRSTHSQSLASRRLICREGCLA
jgi:hypothetical protein